MIKASIITLSLVLLLSITYILIIKRSKKNIFIINISKEKTIVIALLFLLLIMIFLSVILKFENAICYSLIYLVLCFLVFKYSKYDLVSAPVLFLAYYTYIIGLSPIVLMWHNASLNYDYYTFILLPLALYALSIVVLSDLKIEKNKNKNHFKGIKIIDKKNALRILLYMSYAASAYFVYKNFDMFASNNVYSGRMAAISGSGLLINIIQLPIVVIPILYEMLGKGKNEMRKLEFAIYFVISSISILVLGFRAPLMLMLMILTIMIIKKKKFKQTTIVIMVISLLLLASGLDLLRDKNPFTSLSKDGQVSNSHPVMVNAFNLDRVTTTFPKVMPYQKGYTYLINFIMLKPGPDPDFTLWVKKAVNLEFEGGGVTPTINGEFYINFGLTGVYIGFILLGILGIMLGKYSNKRNGDFISTYLIVQYFHSISGGISNVIISIIITCIIYIGVNIFTYNEEKKNG